MSVEERVKKIVCEQLGVSEEEAKLEALLLIHKDARSYIRSLHRQ